MASVQTSKYCDISRKSVDPDFSDLVAVFGHEAYQHPNTVISHGNQWAPTLAINLQCSAIEDTQMPIL